MRSHSNSRKRLIHSTAYIYTCDIVALYNTVHTTLNDVNGILLTVIYVVASNVAIVMYCCIAVNTETESFNVVASYINAIILYTNA